MPATRAWGRTHLELLDVLVLLLVDEVQQRPQLADAVLEGRARKQQQAVEADGRLEGVVEECLLVLQRVRLVDDDVPPLDAPEILLVLHTASHAHAQRTRREA